MSDNGWSVRPEQRLKSMKMTSISESSSKTGNLVEFRHRPSELNGNYAFLSEVLSTAWLPRRLSNKNQTKFTRKFGNISVTVTSGHDPEGNAIGLPSGSYARKLFVSLVDRSFRSQKPLVEFGSIYGILKDAGLAPVGRGPKIFREQALRLSTCHLQIYYKQPNGDYFRYSGSIFDMAELHQVEDMGQMSLIPNKVQFNHLFFTECVQRTSFGYLKNTIHQAKNPLAIDLILWVVRRMAFIKHDVFVPIDRLMEQFANSDKTKVYDFQRNLQRAVDEVVTVTGLNLKLTTDWCASTGYSGGLTISEMTPEQKKRLTRYNPKLREINAK